MAVEGGSDQDAEGEPGPGTEGDQGRFNYCSLPPVVRREFPPGLSGPRVEAILVNEAKWVNGTTLRYYFFDRDTDGSTVTFTDGSTEFRTWTTDEAHKDLVRNAFETWKDIGLGLEFLEVSEREEAEIRIGFLQGDGAWSYVGRDVLGQGPDHRTMNFGWNLVTGPGRPDHDTAIHEIGHTLGLPHEHQNPNAGIVWDEEKVYAELAKPPNSWPREKTHWNIIRKIPPDTVQGSSWDPDSIMHYPFEAGLILKPERFRTQPLVPAGGLSPRDTTWVRTFYPPQDDTGRRTLTPSASQPLSIAAGQQVDFDVQLSGTRNYTFETVGDSDTVMVLFEKVAGALRFRAGDDDSGEDRNARFRVKLFAGRTYVLRIRLYYAWAAGDTAVLMS